MKHIMRLVAGAAFLAVFGLVGAAVITLLVSVAMNRQAQMVTLCATALVATYMVGRAVLQRGGRAL